MNTLKVNHKNLCISKLMEPMERIVRESDARINVTKEIWRIAARVRFSLDPMEEGTSFIGATTVSRGVVDDYCSLGTLLAIKDQYVMRHDTATLGALSFDASMILLVIAVKSYYLFEPFVNFECWSEFNPCPNEVVYDMCFSGITLSPYGKKLRKRVDDLDIYRF